MSIKSVMGIGIVVLSVATMGCERRVSFASDVQPILNEHCAECHGQAGEGVSASGFTVGNYAGVMKGTKYGKMVDPGSSISSSLYLMVAQKTAPEIQMPPHDEKSLAAGRGMPLSEAEVETIRLWIDQGAKDN